MIRYSLIIFLIFCKSVFAEVVMLSDIVKINIPDDKTYIKYNKLEHMLRNMNDAKFTDKEALFYFNKEELILAINKALNMETNDCDKMKKEIINYYDKHLSPESIFDKLSKKVHPLEVFTNVDHASSRRRINRLAQT